MDIIKFVGAVPLVQIVKNESSSEADTSDSSEDEMLIIRSAERINHEKIWNYLNTVNVYSEIDFKSHFRLTKTVVQDLLDELKLKHTSVSVGRPPVNPLAQLLLTLWTLANQESFRGIADRFGLNKGSAHKIFVNVCKLICKKRQKYIVWPTGEILNSTVQDFANLRKHPFPNVIGCIDCTHIQIPGPRKDNSFYNRKGYHSIILQGVCNSKMEFVDVYCGWPGSAHDSRVFQNSPIFHELEENNLVLEQFHILGDTAYPLRIYLLVPFKDNGHLSRNQKNYNRILSSSRVVIEQAFGRLKGVFRRLKYLNIINLENFKYIVVAACILHNIALKRGIEYDINLEDEVLQMENVMLNLDNDAEPENAKNKRNRIMYSL